MGSIGENPSSRPEVGVSTANGRAYYVITNLLKRVGLSYVDILLGQKAGIDTRGQSGSQAYNLDGSVKVIITTRRERLSFFDSNVLCVEDLGDDVGIAREKIFPFLYSMKPSDWFVVGIDPGKRTGVAAFIGHRQVESTVLHSMDATVARVFALIDNAPRSIRKMVKIGSGNAVLASRIADVIKSKYQDRIRIQLVNESGTSSLTRRRVRIPTSRFETRDQRAAKMIAFREGQDYLPEN